MEKKIEQARQEFNAILDYVVNGARGSQIHQAEEAIYRMILRLGCILLELFVLSVGTGKMGDTLVSKDGQVFRYGGGAPRKYLSIFGEITILRAHYAKEGQKGMFPVEAQLNLPERKYSYLLQGWMASKAVATSYERAAAEVSKQLYLKLAHRPIERVTRDCTAAVEEFMDSLPPPRPETEGAILVHTVDCKGIRMRPGERNPDAVKTQDKPGEKRMACAGQTYSINPHFRPNDGIVDSFFGPRGPRIPAEHGVPRPKPMNRRTFVSLKQKKSDVFRWSTGSAKNRVHVGTTEKLAVMDGEKALRKLSEEFLGDWPQALDLTHAVEKVRRAAKLHHGSDPAADEYGREATRLLLEGRVDDVIEDWEIALEDGTLSKGKARELRSKALGYFRNNRDRMAYDELLAKGMPIASGVIESTCNSLINTRMEGAGMYWSVDGAEAILRLRGVFLDELWDEFWAFRTERERKRLYTKYDNIAAVTRDQRQIDKIL